MSPNEAAATPPSPPSAVLKDDEEAVEFPLKRVEPEVDSASPPAPAEKSPFEIEFSDAPPSPPLAVLALLEKPPVLVLEAIDVPWPPFAATPL